jgi:FAS-associated factor 2
MAASAIDVGQLSEEQQLALEQYTSVTDQDIQAAIPLLQRSQWNVQVS